MTAEAKPEPISTFDNLTASEREILNQRADEVFRVLPHMKRMGFDLRAAPGEFTAERIGATSTRLLEAISFTIGAINDEGTRQFTQPELRIIDNATKALKGTVTVAELLTDQAKAALGNWMNQAQVPELNGEPTA